MPEINPLTKDQLFEKKIAENTGSNYNVGDISDVVPVTKDQSLLKEIALNSAGQSEDITELEGKVTANAEAIEAMVNVTGACNVFAIDNPISLVNVRVANYGIVNTEIDNYTTFGCRIVTFDSSGQQIQILAYQNIDSTGHKVLDVTIPDNNYYSLQLRHNGSIRDLAINIPAVPAGDYKMSFDVVGYNPSTVGGLEISNIMLCDARLTPTGYVPYAMTNRELTERAIGSVRGRYNSQYDVSIFEFVAGGVTYALHAAAGGLTYYKDSTKIWDLNA